MNKVLEILSLVLLIVTFGSFIKLLMEPASTSPRIVSITDRYFFFNGAVNKWGRTGAFVGNMTLEAPMNAPTGASNTNGSLVIGASYLAAYTYYNSTTGDESSPSPVSSSVVVSADPNDGITWTVSAYSGTGSCDKIRLYRTVANGTILYLDQEVPSASTSVTSSNYLWCTHLHSHRSLLLYQ